MSRSFRSFTRPHHISVGPSTRLEGSPTPVSDYVTLHRSGHLLPCLATLPPKIFSVDSSTPHLPHTNQLLPSPLSFCSSTMPHHSLMVVPRVWCTCIMTMIHPIVSPLPFLLSRSSFGWALVEIKLLFPYPSSSRCYPSLPILTFSLQVRMGP